MTLVQVIKLQAMRISVGIYTVTTIAFTLLCNYTPDLMTLVAS